MTVEPAAIDLGTYSADSRPDRGDRWRLDWSRVLRSRTWRWLPAVLLVLPLTSAVGPQPPAIVPLWTVSGTVNATPSTNWIRYAVGGDILYLATPRVGFGFLLIAYRLDDGTVRWQTSLGGMAYEVGVRVFDGMPVVTTRDRLGAHSAGFDPGTGRRRWHHDGLPEGTVQGRVVLRQQLAVPVPHNRWELRPYALTAVDLRTGRTAWTLPFDAHWVRPCGPVVCAVNADSWRPVVDSSGHTPRDLVGVEAQWWQPHGDHLLSWDGVDGLRVWRIREGLVAAVAGTATPTARGGSPRHGGRCPPSRRRPGGLSP